MGSRSSWRVGKFREQSKSHVTLSQKQSSQKFLSHFPQEFWGWIFPNTDPQGVCAQEQEHQSWEMIQLFQQLLESPSFPSESGLTFPAPAWSFPTFHCSKEVPANWEVCSAPINPPDPRKFSMEIPQQPARLLGAASPPGTAGFGKFGKRDEQSQKGSV